MACQLGAKVAGYPENFCEAAGLFGRHLGTAYQIFDDLVDLYADESMIGKTLGTDLQKGKFTGGGRGICCRARESHRRRGAVRRSTTGYCHAEDSQVGPRPTGTHPGGVFLKPLPPVKQVNSP